MARLRQALYASDGLVSHAPDANKAAVLLPVMTLLAGLH